MDRQSKTSPHRAKANGAESEHKSQASQRVQAQRQYVSAAPKRNGNFQHIHHAHRKGYAVKQKDVLSAADRILPWSAINEYHEWRAENAVARKITVEAKSLGNGCTLLKLDWPQKQGFRRAKTATVIPLKRPATR